MTFNTEIEKTKQEIKMLQSKLVLLEEMENYKTPAEEAYKKIYGNYPMGEPFWIVFKKGYEAHQSLVDDAKKIVDEASMTDCIIEGNPPNGCSDWYSWFQLFGSKGILHNLRISSKDNKAPKPEYPDEPEYDLKEEISPPEPTSSEFRQKLFEGIKSVFYGPEYERTHWKMKVNMVVDEVLTHFLEALPEPEEYIGDYGPSQEYVYGFNHYDELIKEKLQGY